MLHKHPHASRLPYLFQLFSETLGGFLVPGDAEEMALVERLSGIPAKELVDCIKLLDKFFAPPKEGSFFYQQGSEIFCMKMVPGVVRGGGAFFRKCVFNISNYSTRYPKMGWLVGEWHNAAYNVLEPHLKREEQSNSKK